MIYLPITSKIDKNRSTNIHTSYHLDDDLYNELIEWYDDILIMNNNKNIIHFYTNQFWQEPRFLAVISDEAATYWKLKL